MQFGMPTLIENKTLAQNIWLCHRLGLHFIELNMNFPEYQMDQLEELDSLYRLAEAADIYYTIHLDEALNVADFNPLIADAYFETVRRTIAVAKKLIGLKNQYGQVNQPVILNMHMNHGIHITLPDQRVQLYERDFDLYMDSFRRFRDRCEEWIEGQDLLITIENTDGFHDYEKKAMEYLLQSTKFALTWDIGHAKESGETDASFLLQHADKIKHFHIHDAREADSKSHLALGDGEINLMERLSMARQCNARCVLETKTIAALEKSIAWVRKNYCET